MVFFVKRATGGGQLSGELPNLSFSTFTPDTYILTYRVQDETGTLSNISTITFVIGAPSGYTAKGQVISADPNATRNLSVKNPLANVQLRLEHKGKIIGTTATDSHGHYMFYGVSEGNYLVFVDSITVDGSKTILPFVFSRKLKIQPKKMTPDDAQFAVPAFIFYSIWRQVMLKGKDDSIRTTTPFEGAKVRLNKRHSERYPAYVSEMVTDKNGFYLFKYLGRGSFKINASANGITFARNHVKVNLPDFGRRTSPSSSINLKGTKNASVIKPSFNAN